MKILELCTYSASGDGVFARVKQESLLLAKRGHEIRIFSTNLEKGTNKIVPYEDKIENVKIKRFPARKIGGESYMSWNKNNVLVKAIIEYKPEIIIAHSYRHTHTIIASRIAKKIGARVFLVTHAPFARSQTRSLLAKLYIKYFHEPFVGRPALKRFDKVIAITNWEIPYLLSLGVPKEKIEHIPNGIPEEFFSQKKKAKEERKILYLGRISPIKNLETAIRALHLLDDKNIKLELLGPAEQDYLVKLKLLIKKYNLEKRVIIVDKKYNKDEEINWLDSAFIYILPSISEGMPQTLIEAMARKKIVLASNNLGNSDLIKDGENGFLFKVGDEKDLAEKINRILEMRKADLQKIKKEARKSVQDFSWSKIIKKIEYLINS